jgi:hypothetical protein
VAADEQKANVGAGVGGLLCDGATFVVGPTGEAGDINDGIVVVSGMTVLSWLQG